MSYNYVVTNKGLDMIALVQSDPTKKIEFVRAEIGNGDLPDNATPENYEALLGSIKKNAVIQKKEFLNDESVKVTVSYDNNDVTTGFSVKEVGLYAKDPLDDSKEILFLYCNSSDADFLPDNTSAVNVEQVVNLIIKMSNAENVTVTTSPLSNVMKESFGANTILKADVEGEPYSLKVEPGRVVGRKGNESDKIEDLEPSDVREILNVPELVDGKISNQHNNVTSSPRQAILALNDISYKTTNVKIADEHTYTGNGVVRELDFGMDFVNQNSVNQYGGIAFGKNVAAPNMNIRFTDSDMEDNQYLCLSDTNTVATSDIEVRKFTEKGIEVGSGSGLNALNEESEFIAFQTTKKEQKKIYEGVKSVAFKCLNGWGGSNTRIGLRRVEFYNGEERYNLTSSDYTAYASSEHSTRYLAKNAFDTSLSFIGSHEDNEWLTDNDELKNQSLIIVFNNTINITHIEINNSHHNGTSYIDFGVKDLDVIFTDQTLEALHTTWDSSIPNGETVWSGRLSPHIASNVEDPETIMYTPWRYNPNNGFAFQTRTGRNVAEQIKNPPEMDGMKLCFRFTKNIDRANQWYAYTDKLPATQGLCLSLASPPNTAQYYSNNEEPTTGRFSIGNIDAQTYSGSKIKDFCFFGKDLSYIEPGLTGVEGATAFMSCDPGQTFDCGLEPQMIIYRSLEVNHEWRVYTKNDNFENLVMYLSDPGPKVAENPTSKPNVNGTKITAPVTTEFGKYLIMAFAEVVSVPADNKVINTIVKSSPGTLAEREVDMGMDFVSDENGGMVLTKGGSNYWYLFDTVRGPLKRLNTCAGYAEDSDPNFLQEFTKNGVKVGSDVSVNGESDQFYMGFQTDEKVKPPKWKAKSVVFDIANNYGATDYIRLRSIEFYKNGILLPFTESDFICSSTADNASFKPEKIFVTGNSKTGSDENTGWRSNTNVVADQRILINFNTEIEFDKIVINNGHDGGGSTNSGVKHIDIQITDYAYDTIIYGAIVTGSVNRIFKSNILQHPASDDIDDKIYVDISDEWQVNRASGFGMCKIQGTSANRVLRTPFGKEPAMFWWKNINSATGWITYFHALGAGMDLRLDTPQAEGATSNFKGYKSEDGTGVVVPYSKDEFYLGAADPGEYIIYAWFGDYFQDSGTGEVVPEDNKRVMGIKGTTAFFKGTKSTAGTDVYETHIDDIETIIWKSRTDGTGKWNLINKSLNNFQDGYYLDANETMPSVNGISVNGSKVSVNTSTPALDTIIFMVFGRTADKDTKEYIPWMKHKTHIGTGATDTHIDLGLDFTGDNGGMIINKSLDDNFSWIMSDTLRGPEKYLVPDATNAEASASESLNEYTSSGIRVGSQANLNKLNSEIATFGFQTTHKTKPTTREKVKSVIFKFEDSWGDPSYMGVRRIEFFKGDTPINMGDTDFKAYSTSSDNDQDAKYAFITSGSKIGVTPNKGWNTSAGQTTNQVLIIVFTNTQDIDYIRVNNFHATGSNTDIGVKNTKVYFTDYEYTEEDSANISYNSEVPNTELVYDGVFDQHHASNSECYTQYLYTPWHYNPQTGFGFFTHKGNGTEITIPNILGKQPTMIWNKNLSSTTNWMTYSNVTGENYYGYLSTNNKLNNYDANTFKKINKDLFEFGNSENDLNNDYITYVWVGDDMSTLGNPQEAFGITGTSLFTEVKAGDLEIELGFETEVLLIKALYIDGGEWKILFSRNENMFDSMFYIDLPDAKNIGDSNKWMEGTKLKFGTAFSSDHLICAFAKDTYKPQGKSLVIHGSESNPSLFSIANGFNEYQAVEKLIGYKRNVVFSFNEGDGTYYIKLNIDGTITLKNENCFYGRTNSNSGQDFFDVEKYKMYSPSGSVVPGIYIGKIVIQNDAILDVEKFQTGTNTIVDWFPVGVNTMYIKDNPFFTNEIDWDIWWNSTDSDENMRHVTGQFYYDLSNNGCGMGAYKRQNSNEIIVGSAKTFTLFSFCGDGMDSKNGYYKLVIKRKF
ncbi:MAG: DUF4457 domain-containing protein [Desulfobacterales bacterium]|nr:DUF4457 domain-containing protein [Desulfobacterales bacterium]